MNKLEFHTNKVLKLKNVLKYKINIGEENLDFNVIIQQMNTYIKTKGFVQIGPLIQYTRTFLNGDGEFDMEIILMLQCNNFIHNVEKPYFMESTIRIPNALYCRYTGPESNLKFAYDKINIEAFEEDVSLKGSSYTIFINKNQEEDTIIADVFMERAD